MPCIHWYICVHMPPPLSLSVRVCVCVQVKYQITLSITKIILKCQKMPQSPNFIHKHIALSLAQVWCVLPNVSPQMPRWVAAARRSQNFPRVCGDFMEFYGDVMMGKFMMGFILWFYDDFMMILFCYDGQSACYICKSSYINHLESDFDGISWWFHRSLFGGCWW